MKQDHSPGPPPQIARRGNRISLCMIVRDEEQYLGQCLDSVLGVADEIVIVDTGSEDRTVAIAKSHDAKVIHFAWTEHFAEARNQAIAAATGDYMLVLDADERLDVATAYHIREVVDADEFDVAYLQFENVAEAGTARRRWIAPRLYRMTPGIRYIGRVHEQVGQGLSEVRTCTIEARVRHYGYQQAVFVEREKARRNTGPRTSWDLANQLEGCDWAASAAVDPTAFTAFADSSVSSSWVTVSSGAKSRVSVSPRAMRTLASTSSRMSGFSSRNSLEFSLPCPRRRSP